MKKLHLTSFVFTTGENEYTEYRITVARDREEATKLALAWFPTEYTESELIACITHEAIEDVEVKKVVDKTQSIRNHFPKYLCDRIEKELNVFTLDELQALSDEKILSVSMFGKMALQKLRRL